MCGRFTLRTPETTIASLFPDLAIPDLKPRFNIAPTQQVACVRKTDQLKVVTLRWGLVPFWAKDLKIGAKMINARCETVESKPSFRSAFKKRRCLVFADGYFEWKKIDGAKQPYYMTTTENGGGFCMAGLWEKWKDKENDETVESCTVLTTDANSKLSGVHDRMPVVLDRKDFEFWLDPEFQAVDKLKSILKPASEEFFDAVPVDRTVNNVRNDNPTCVRTVVL